MAATTVLERASLRVLDYRCTEPPGAPGFVEHHGEHSLAYVRSGSFGYHSRGRRHELVAGSLLVGRPGDDHVCTHDHAHPGHAHPGLGAWRIAWSNPARNHHELQTGRWSGKDIVQLGVRPTGVATRWMFTEITPRSFHWLGDALAADGTTWIRESEFLATRVG